MRELWRLVDPCVGFTIPIRCVPKKRHNNQGKTPLATVVFEQEIVSPISSEAWSQPPTLRNVGLVFDFYYFNHEPDISNAVKSIEDGMNSVVYVDDKQVVYEEICRHRCTSKADERAEVLILLM